MTMREYIRRLLDETPPEMLDRRVTFSVADAYDNTVSCQVIALKGSKYNDRGIPDIVRVKLRILPEYRLVDYSSDTTKYGRTLNDQVWQ